MERRRIGVQISSLKQPLRQALHTAARLGAQAVELEARGDLSPRKFTQTGLRDLRKQLEDLNLRICAVAFPTRRGYNVPDDLDARVAATKEALAFAYRLGTGVLINHVGVVPAESEGPEWELMLAALTDILTQTLVQSSVPNELRGRAMGSWILAIGFGPVGHVQIGVLAAVLSVTAALTINGVLLAALALTTILKAQRIRRM